MSNKTILYLLIAAVVIAGLLFIISPNSEEPAPENPDNTTPATSTEPIYASKNAIQVYSQRPSTRVIVASVLAEKPGFAVIHNSVGDNVGTVIGNSALLPAGESKNVEVDLSRRTVNGTVYWAVLHSDNGDKTFDANLDPIVKDEAGNPVQMKFAAESVLDTDGSVRIQF